MAKNSTHTQDNILKSSSSCYGPSLVSVVSVSPVGFGYGDEGVSCTCCTVTAGTRQARKVEDSKNPTPGKCEKKQKEAWKEEK